MVPNCIVSSNLELLIWKHTVDSIWIALVKIPNRIQCCSLPSTRKPPNKPLMKFNFSRKSIQKAIRALSRLQVRLVITTGDSPVKVHLKRSCDHSPAIRQSSPVSRFLLYVALIFWQPIEVKYMMKNCRDFAIRSNTRSKRPSKRCKQKAFKCWWDPINRAMINAQVVRTKRPAARNSKVFGPISMVLAESSKVLLLFAFSANSLQLNAKVWR